MLNKQFCLLADKKKHFVNFNFKRLQLTFPAEVGFIEVASYGTNNLGTYGLQSVFVNFCFLNFIFVLVTRFI